MLSIANEGDRGVNIKPSARKSIHADCTTCTINKKMGRYGCYAHHKGKQNNASTTEQSHGADEVDNVMSKFALQSNNTRCFTTGKSVNRRNSIDVPANNDSDDTDEDMLSKSSPATFFLPYSSEDETFRSATQNDSNTSRDGFQSSTNSPLAIRNTRRSHVHTPVSPQNRQITREHTLEPSNIGRTQNNIRRSDYETTIRGGSKFKYIGLMFVIAVVAIGVNSDYFSQTTDTVNDIFSSDLIFYDDIKSLGAKYKVSSDSILQIKSGISTVSKNQDAASFIFIYDSEAESFNSKVLYSFVEELALKTIKYLRNQSNSIENVIVDTDQIETESELRALQSEVEKTGVMIVPNINNVPSELAMAFHYYCDEYNPLVKGSAIFFTLDAATCLHNKKVTHQFVEKCLLKKWNDIHKDKIGPLLTRVVNVVIDITNIMLL